MFRAIYMNQGERSLTYIKGGCFLWEIVFWMGFKMGGRTEGIGINGYDLRVQGVEEKIILVNSQFKLKLLQTSVKNED